MTTIATADGTRLHVKIWGEGRPVVLMHGWPLSADSWDDQAMELAENGLRVIAYDRRGFGRSDQPFNGYDYDALSDDLAAVLAETGAAKAGEAAIVGFSMGGGEVARYMTRHGGRGVKQAVLVSSVVPYMPRTTDNPEGVPVEAFDKMAEDIIEDRAKFFAGFFKDFFGRTLLAEGVSDQRIQWCCQVAMQAGLKPTLACAKAFATTDFRPDLKAFKVPTLIIHGTDDKTVPIAATSRVAAGAIAGSTLVEYVGAPHGLFATHRERLTKDLLMFLQR